MKISIEEKPELQEPEILIKCHQKDAEVDKILSVLDLLNLDIIGKKDDVNHVLKLEDIFYFESVDERVFCYTRDDTYEVKYRLYELEEILAHSKFARISISMILNLTQITNFKSSFNGRMEAKLKNGEVVEIARTYVPMLKRMLGGQ